MKRQGASLKGAKLEGVNFDEAKADRYTIWPEGFEVPEGVVV